MTARTATPTAIWTGVQSGCDVGRPSAVRGAEKIGHIVAGEPLERDQDEHDPMQRDLARAVTFRNHQEPPCLQRLGVDAEHIAPHPLERIKFGDMRARPLADRLPRRRAERQRLLDGGGERRRVAGRNDPAGTRSGGA